MKKTILILITSIFIVFGCFDNMSKKIQETNFKNTNITYGEIINNYKFFDKVEWNKNIAVGHIENMNLKQIMEFDKDTYQIKRITFVFNDRELPGVNVDKIFHIMMDNGPVRQFISLF